MRIGIDAHILGKGKGGVERVVHQMVALLPGLLPDDEFIIFTRRGYVPRFPACSNVRYIALSVSDPVLQRSLVLPWLARRERLDLLHVQRAAPPRTRGKLIVHTHDLLPLTAPEDHRGWRDRLVRVLTPRSLRRANLVLTVSESVAQEIARLFPEVAGKVRAIYNGIDTEMFKPAHASASRTAVDSRFGLTGSYILYLGALMSRKNLEVAIEGYAQFVKRWPRHAAQSAPKLVIAGMSRSEDYAARLRRLAQELAPDAVHFAGFISDVECVALLQHASAFLAPSRGEGFDLPALEAMACGIPVVCSDIPVHRELLGDEVLFFSTDSADDLGAQLSALFAAPDLLHTLKRAGPKHAARFSWARSMQQLAQLYRALPAHSTLAAVAV